MLCDHWSLFVINNISENTYFTTLYMYLCRREKLQADKYQLQTTEIPNKPFAKVSIDLIVDLPISHNGNKNIFVMIDHLTGWRMAKAIPNKEATNVANAVFEKLILEHGPPSILLSDNGTEFSNDHVTYIATM